MIYYLRKNYYKNASLMDNSCKLAVVLGSYDYCTVRVAYNYGNHGGIAFQIVDEVLEFDVDGQYGGGNNNNGGGGTRKKTEKGRLTIPRSGAIMAPVLCIKLLYPDQFNPLIESKFKGNGNI